MSITVTITSDRQLAGAAAAAAASVGEGDTPPTAEAYLQSILEGACESYRNQFGVDRITSSAFVLRFTSAEYAAIRTAAETDSALAAFVARLDAEPYVWLASDEVQQAMAYVVASNLVTQARADEILTY